MALTTAIITYALTGLAMGWLATLSRGRREGQIMFTMLIGLAGGLVGGFIFRAYGILSASVIGGIFTAIVGAAALLLAAYFLTLLAKQANR